ncbi:MAG: beta-ketoacyl-[acyl-carrier-protein] synthase family protein [Myxococcota bacterium]
MSTRVVVTGLGTVTPNANTVDDFGTALRTGRSGIRADEAMAELGFASRVSGVPEGTETIAESYFPEDLLRVMNLSHRYAAIAALDAWADAGLELPDPDAEPDWETGTVLGTGVGGMDTIAERVVPFTAEGRVRRLGSTAVEQVMASGVSARVSGLLGLGNQATTNSSACSTGAEAVAMGAERIRNGQASRMLCGGSEAASPYISAGFDAMRVLCRQFNEDPEAASRPMSASAAGFVVGSGAGLLMLESLESAVERGARIRGEILGYALNCGGQRGGGSMTAPNPQGVRRCVGAALADANIGPTDVGAINCHLTATGADPREVEAWADALSGRPDGLPPITSTKSLIGHALGGAGAIESVACLLMLEGGFVHPSINCRDVHPDIEPWADSIPHEVLEAPDLDIVIKSGFGFGDVNVCLVFCKWDPDRS